MGFMRHVFEIINSMRNTEESINNFVFNDMPDDDLALCWSYDCSRVSAAVLTIIGNKSYTYG